MRSVRIGGLAWQGMDLEGRTLDDRYEVGRRLASTWISSLWAARDLDKDRDVWIRLPSDSLLDLPGFRNTALTGFRARVDISEPGVAKVVAVGEFQEVPFAVLAPPASGSLAARLEKADMPLAAVAGWLPVLAGVLDRMHERSVVHRDVVAGHVFFDARQEPLLVDSSLSEALAKSAPSASPPVKTPGELGDLPPEALEGRCDPAWDQYCLAAIVFRCVAGRALAPDDAYLGAKAAVEGKIPPASAEALERALAVVPGDRFPSVGAFSAALLGGAGLAADSMDETATMMLNPEDLAAAGAAETTSEIPLAAPLPVEEAEPVPVPAAIAVEEVAHPSTSRRAERRPGGHSPATKILVALGVILLAGIGLTSWMLLSAHGTPGKRDEGKATPAPVHPDRKVAAQEGPKSKPEHEPKSKPVATAPWTGTAVLEEPQNDAIVGKSPVRIRGRVEGSGSGFVVIAGKRVEIGPNGAFTADVRLTPGENRISAVPHGPDGATGKAAGIQIVLDTDPPQIALADPTRDFATRKDEIKVAGRLVDDHPGSVTVNGTSVPVDADGAFATTVRLTRGPNRITITARDAAGNPATPVERTVLLDTFPPVLRIDSPAEGALTRDATISLKGTIRDEDPARVLVNGKPADLAKGTFTADVPLSEGPNPIDVKGFDRAGNSSGTRITVIRDSKAPEVELLSPADGARVEGGEVEVRGRATDDHPVSVTVSGKKVPVGKDGSFSVKVPISGDETRIEVSARDAAGNQSPTILRTIRRVVRRPAKELSLAVADVGVDAVTSETVEIRGTVGAANARLTVNGRPAEGKAGKFYAVVSLKTGVNELKIRAEAPGYAVATRTLKVVRLARGVPVSGPMKIRTAAGEVLDLGPSGKMALGSPAQDGAEVFDLSAGRVTGSLGGTTRIDLPAGRLAAGRKEEAVFAASATSREAAQVSVTKGIVLVTEKPDRFVVVSGQSLSLTRDGKRPGWLGFQMGKGNGQKVTLLRQVSPNLTIWLWLPAGASGEIEPASGGKATRIRSDSSSPDDFGGKAVRKGQGTDTFTIAPGKEMKIPDER